MKKYFAIVFFSMLAAFALTNCAPAPVAQAMTVTMRNGYGSVVGNVVIAPSGENVKFSFQLRGLPPGKHGWHIHAVGKCDGFDFTSAGAHFNPDNKKHGLQSADGPHAGDSEGLEVKADGSADFDFTDKLVKFAAGAPNSILQKDGLAIVVHAADDDQKTDPTGNSGARIACGAIVQ